MAINNLIKIKVVVQEDNQVPIRDKGEAKSGLLNLKAQDLNEK